MLRLYSTEQALALRGTIPELTITRSLQFQSDGYDSEEHGHIIVIQQGDDISLIPEIVEAIGEVVEGGEVKLQQVYRDKPPRGVRMG